MKLALTTLASKIKNKDEFNKFISFLDNQNIEYIIGDTCYQDSGYLGASDEDKVLELDRFMKDETITHIFCYKGGNGTGRLMDKINFMDYDGIQKSFSGFSDITTLINNMPSSIKCFHGPMAYNVVHESTFNDLFEHINKGTIKHGLDLNFKNCEKMEGEIVGGNISLICSLMGTPYEIDVTNKYFLLEEVGEYPYVIDRMLNQLRLAGVLDKAKGFIIGTFEKCNPDEDGITVQQIIEEYIYVLNKPMITNYPIGHNFDTYTLPIKQPILIDHDKITYL